MSYLDGRRDNIFQAILLGGNISLSCAYLVFHFEYVLSKFDFMFCFILTMFCLNYNFYPYIFHFFLLPSQTRFWYKSEK